MNLLALLRLSIRRGLIILISLQSFCALLITLDILQRGNHFSYWFISGALALLIVAVLAALVIAHDATAQSKAEAELVRRRIMQQQLITETALQVQEKEREELGKELHDNINQMLTATKLYLELALTNNPQQSREMILKSSNSVNVAIDEIRQLSRQLVPLALDTSLLEAIGELTEEIQAIAPIEITLELSKFDETLLDEDIKLMIYRIVQEQVNNVLKHAAATRMEIKIETMAKTLHLLIADNGRGIDPEKKSRGIGLRNIENRVKFHSGTMQIISKPGEGFKLEISVPLEKRMSNEME